MRPDGKQDGPGRESGTPGGRARPERLGTPAVFGCMALALLGFVYTQSGFPAGRDVGSAHALPDDRVLQVARALSEPMRNLAGPKSAPAVKARPAAPPILVLPVGGTEWAGRGAGSPVLVADAMLPEDMAAARQSTARPRAPARRPRAHQASRGKSRATMAKRAAKPAPAQAQAPKTDAQAVPAVAHRQLPQTPGRLSINFSDTDVRQALATIGRYGRLDILVTPGAKGLVTINLRQRTPEEAVRMVAAAGGLSALNMGQSWVVGPDAEVRAAATQFGRTEVVALRYAKPEDARSIVARAAPRCTVEAAGNSVVLSGLAEDVEAAKVALAALDVAPVLKQEPVSTELVTLRYVDPQAAERIFREAFPQLKIVRQERVLAFTGCAVDLQAIGRAVKVVDGEPAKPEVAPEVREAVVYRLRYLNAKKAEEALKKALPTLSVSAGPEATAPPPAVFQPLSLTMFGNSTSGGGTGGGGTGGTGGYGGMSGGSGGPGDTVQALSRATTLILVGNRADVASARAILVESDVAPPLVQIQAAIVEVDRTRLRELGILWDFSGTDVDITVPGGKGLHFGSIRFSDLGFTASLRALIEETDARILANPSISVVDNEDASIFIGDLIRYRGINVITPNVGTVQGTETIPVGIALLVRPRIHPEGGVTMKVHPVVSTISAFVDGLPQTASREADTTVRLARGEQLVIGGLDREEMVRTVQRTPFLSDIPVLGELFKRRNNRLVQSEVIVLVAAYTSETTPAPQPGQFPSPTVLPLTPTPAGGSQ